MTDIKTPQLTERQKRFVNELDECGSQAEAARRAGYSERTAKEIASENLTKPNVKAALQAKRAERAANSEERRAYWVSHLESLAAGAERESDQLRAVEMLMRAEGWNEPEKTETTTYSGSFLADLDLDQDESPQIAVDPGPKSSENKGLAH